MPYKQSKNSGHIFRVPLPTLTTLPPLHLNHLRTHPKIQRKQTFAASDSILDNKDILEMWMEICRQFEPDGIPAHEDSLEHREGDEHQRNSQSRLALGQWFLKINDTRTWKQPKCP